MFESKNKKNTTIFHLKITIFTAVKNHSVLHGRVIVRRFILAHLSQRLIGELIGYPWSGVRCLSSSVVVRPQFQMSSPLKPLGQSKPNFMCSLLGPGHMTKMAATPIYGKKPSKIFFSRTGGPIFTKLGM